MKYRTIGTDPRTRREVSVLALGAMLFGSVTDEKTSFAILVIATKLGARPLAPGTSYVDHAEGLSAKVIRESAERSRERLGTDRLDVLYAHIEDPKVHVRETVEGFAALVDEGTVGVLGVSNHAVWRVERARALAAAAGLPGYEVLQYAHSHLRPRSDVPGDLFPDGSLGHAGPDLLGYLRDEPGLTLVAYSPLLKGAYTRPERLPSDYDHPGTPARLKVLHAVARETGATVDQVVLARQIGDALPVIPLVGVSSVAQLEENLAAVDLELTPEQRARLDAAH
ncbi:aldo/keto reductase [Streptomyces sp. NRRL S-146]|uniref:aldo/keto reductase n=1 Tax=Streptomyces sp. NRRL S-146 TaxID=1463884 RepID=UPI0004C9F0E1|nr:aldo/keto reductase [Streptomyces sp. NRRL S-146]